MTLNQIFNTIQYGEEYTKYQIVKEEVENTYDSETGIFYASKRIKNLAKTLPLNEAEDSRVGRMVAKIEAIESKMENGKTMTPAYRKMEASSIMEDCTSLMNGVEKLVKVDSGRISGISKIISTAKYFTLNNVDEKAVLKESKNPLINRMIKEDMDYISQTI